MYKIEQQDGLILIKGEYLQEVIQDLVRYKAEEIQRYNSVVEMLEYERYKYLADIQRFMDFPNHYYDYENFMIEEFKKVFNDPQHVAYECSIEISKI